MDTRQIRRPSAALVVSMLALFVALAGTAGAVTLAVVPLAKRALIADNAKKLQGKTAVDIAAAGAQASAQIPGPASTASGLVSVQTAPFNLAAGAAGTFSAACSGAKAISGGFNPPNGGAVLGADSSISSDGATYSIFLLNIDTSAASSGNVYAVCLK
jgi:hypothetical protein